MKSLNWLSLTGVAAVVLVFASFVAAGDTPTDPNTPIDDVIAFYSKHDTAQVVSANLLATGALLFLAFTVAVSRFLDGAAGCRAFGSRLCFAGGIVMVTGFLFFAGVSLSLGQVVGEADRSTIQVLNVLTNEMYFPLSVGPAAFLFGAAISILDSSALPKWLAWFAIVFGAIALIPGHVLGGILDHLPFLGVIGLFVWTVIVSVMLSRKAEAA